MPIYDQSYRPYRGTLYPHTWRWWTITKAGLMHYLSLKLFLVFLFIGYIPAIAWGGIIWFNHQAGTAGFITIDANFFRNFLFFWQSPFLMLVCIWPGALLIARDLRTNAIQLYLSKPLTQVDYILGKFAIIAGIGAILLPAPALLLFLMEVGLSNDTSFLLSNFWVPLAILGYSAVVITGAGLVTLAVSSITRSARYAGLLFFAIVFFSTFTAGMLRLITGNHFFVVLSMYSLMDQAGALFFGGPTEYGLHPLPSLIVYGLVLGFSMWILRRRVKAVEIVT